MQTGGAMLAAGLLLLSSVQPYWCSASMISDSATGIADKLVSISADFNFTEVTEDIGGFDGGDGRFGDMGGSSAARQLRAIAASTPAWRGRLDEKYGLDFFAVDQTYNRCDPPALCTRPPHGSYPFINVILETSTARPSLRVGYPKVHGRIHVHVQWA